jgi:hypothetical protein
VRLKCTTWLWIMFLQHTEISGWLSVTCANGTPRSQFGYLYCVQWNPLGQTATSKCRILATFQGQSQSLKRKNSTPWCGWLPEGLLLNFVAVKASSHIVVLCACILCLWCEALKFHAGTLYLHIVCHWYTRNIRSCDGWGRWLLTCNWIGLCSSPGQSMWMALGCGSVHVLWFSPVIIPPMLHTHSLVCH